MCALVYNLVGKGEAISTVTVAEVLMRFPGIVEATAYGVHLAGYEGRPCMAAVVLAPGATVETHVRSGPRRAARR